MNLINEISSELTKRNIFHKIEKNFIRTRKSKIKVPIITNDIAYLLGVIRGDGSLCQSKRKKGGYHYIFRIYSGEEKYLNYLNKLFKDLFLIEGKIIKDKRKQNAYHLVIKNVIIFFYFVSLGSEIGKKKFGKLPQIVKDKQRYFRHYLAGLVDTDGSTYNKRIQLKQKSRPLLKNIRVLANRMGLNCSEPKVNYTNQKPYYYIRFDNRLPLRLKQSNF
ncbi:hypothetical protein GOV13_00455 [Candidatus Pacearchaeota archaeon]|nr:hypothetical protein [Candidatus Pacearchaeota archaeon]